jgi:glutamate synthase domain-containing protein 1
MTSGMPKPQGLYDPRFEHDACGIGAIVNISGRREHQIVDLGKTVLVNLMHRGAAGADDSTGDGAGILMQLPHELFRAEADRLGIALPEPPKCVCSANGSSKRRSPRDNSRPWAGGTCLATTAVWATSPERPNR